MTPRIFRTASVPASWEEGLIAGSGRVGVVVHGRAGRQVLSIAHERFFVPVNSRPPAPDLRPVLADLRRAVAEGEPGRAGELLQSALRTSGYPDGLVWTDPVGICASLTVSSPADAGPLRREVDLDLGEVAVHWDDDAAGRCTVRVLTPGASRPSGSPSRRSGTWS